jgi:hypothetical protein
VYDLKNHRFWGIEPFTQSLVTHSLEGYFTSELAKRMQEACSDPDMPSSEILGYRVVRFQQSLELAEPIAERVVQEFWLAPDLGCFPLRRTTTGYRGNQIISHNVLVFTEIDEVEPPDWMFEIPKAYNVIDYAQIPRGWRAPAKP